MTTNVIQSNFASGELSPKVWGRYDLKIFRSGLEIMENFIAEIQGSARFRTGTIFVWHTRLNQHAILIPFQFNDEQAYMMEFTEGYIRFYRNGGIILETGVAIEGVSLASPCVVTATAHPFAIDDEIYISGIVGTTELNGKSYRVEAVTANSYSLKDIDGVTIDSTAYTAWVSGGTGARVYEITNPYHDGDEMYALKYAQNADVMYITDPHGNDVRKLTRTDHTAWTLNTYARTNDKHPSKTITGATAANPVVITATAHGFSDGDIIAIHEVVGMVEINHTKFFVNNKTANDFELQDLTGTNVDGTGYTAYSSGGKAGDPPQSVAFYEGRLVFGGSFNFPETFWISRSPDSAGATRYDDFTTGTDADHAAIFTLSPTSSGKVDHIEWVAGGNEFLVIGTFGGISKANGGGVNEPITPLSISVKPITEVGCADLQPVPQGTTVLYLQRGGRSIRSLEYDAIAESYQSVDRNLVADHIFDVESYCKQIAYEEGSPNILWGVRADGQLAGVTMKSKEDVTGWHRQLIGGDHTDDNGDVTKSKVLSVGTMPQANNYDQTWLVVERKVGAAASGVTRRYVEYFADTVSIPRKEEFYSGASNETADQTRFANAMFEQQKLAIHLDSSISLNTSESLTQNATLSIPDVTGDSLTFTAGAAVFAGDSTDVGKQIWKKAIDGVGYGRAIVVAFIDTTTCTVDIEEVFDDADLIPAGGWFFSTPSVLNINHLEGATVGVIADGKDIGDFTVTNGTFSLGTQASVIHVGLRYVGLIKSLDVEVGGVQGAAQTRQRNVEKAAIRFLGTLQAKAGSHRYGLEEIPETN